MADDMAEIYRTTRFVTCVPEAVGGSGNPSFATAKGVAWLSILSSGAGQQGHMTPDEANTYFARQQAAPSAIVLDPTGAIGRLYDAKTTPHMFVINPDGVVVYNGAIDDKRSSNPADAKTANNYVRAALTEALAGKPVTTSSTSPYGCSVKY